MLTGVEIISFFEQYYSRFGLQLIFFGALLENVFPIGYFIPGSTIVWLGAFYSYNGIQSVAHVFFLGTLGAFIGHHVDYLMGRYGWYRLFSRYIDETRLQEAGGHFKGRRYFEALILYFIGYTRSLLIIAVGVFQIPYFRFAAFALVSSLLWNFSFLIVGLYFGSQRALLERGLTLFWVFGLLVMSFYLLPKFLNRDKILSYFDNTE